MSTTRELANAGSAPQAREGVEAIGIDHHRHIAFAQQVDDQAIGGGVVPEAGAQGERVLAREQSSSTGPASGAMVSRSVIGNARTIASGRPTRIGVSRQPGTPMVTRPTPARSAPRPARCAAPP